MSTLVPLRSAKRQRLADAAESKAADALAAKGQLGPKASSIVVQLQSGQDGSILGPSISLPAETGQKQLQMIVNKLRRELKGKGKAGDEEDEDDLEDVPYAFHVALSSNKTETAAEGERFSINTSLLQDVLSTSTATKLGLSTEDVLTIVFEPQAVFRVRPVTRCSSTLSGHSSPILCSVFSPTGSLLLTGSGDHTARLWDLDSEMPLHALSGHGNWVLCADWEGRERKVATGDMNGDIMVWDAMDASGGKTGKKAWGSRSGKDVEQQAAASGEGEDGKPKKLTVAQKRALRHAAPQGHALKGHSKWITSLAWEPIHLNASTPRLASSSKDGTVRVWSASGSRGCDYVLGGHTASVNAVRWGGDGLLYTASSDRSVKVWSAKEGKLVRSLDQHAHWVNTLSLSTDWVLRTGPFDHLGRLFDPSAATKASSKRISAAQEAEQLAALPDAELDARTQRAALQRFQAATANGREELCISGSDDHTLFLWPHQANALKTEASTSPKKPLARLTGHQKVVNHVAFSPDGRLIASASFDTSVKLWDARTGKFIANLRAHVAPVYRLAWSADSRLLVTASKDSTIKLWDMRTYKLKVDLPGHEDEVYCVDFVANKVASGGRDRVLKIWQH